jgi:hypothetical protein
MNLYITGTHSKSLLAYIERVVVHLGLEDQMIDLDIKSHCDNNAGGYCHGDLEEVKIEVSRNDDQGKLPTKQLMINIAHELIHAQQMHKGRMDHVGMTLTEGGFGYSVLWDGEEGFHLPYLEQPWEIDAYSREQEVYEACL